MNFVFFLTESRYVYQLIVEINEQLSQRNSLNALRHRPNCVNSVVFQNCRLYVWEQDIKWLSMRVTCVNSRGMLLHSLANGNPGTPTAHVT